jgi:hypothetical protein
MSKCLCGSIKIACGVVTCPIVCVSSFLIGCTMTCSQCCQCMNEEFIKEREKLCYYCGVGTSIDVANYLCRQGYRDIYVEHEMIR